ncbi:GIY-YIG nuclease family protein [Clostridium fallax]|uniref:Putative endonuclease n=1 Tax=Clostridium fallax TaxID=1533 RepID=A0A1M4W920_9CLOT|nr:GIY-YIG nuclease family protein [Clostridium fallax]SHE77583.1 putative endonuclease [Clostridium fallax]SQB05953.1 GIY-YIG domain-containing protein [Clostridium fallax]
MAYVYIVICCDDTLYTGWTTDIKRRLYEHNYSKKGAKYTRGRRPVKLVFMKAFSSKIDAQKEEYLIKNLNRRDKLILINSSLNEINKIL